MPKAVSKELRPCRTCKRGPEEVKFSKNPGRDSWRLDCNSCRSIAQYAKQLDKKKKPIVYISLSQRMKNETKQIF